MKTTARIVRKPGHREKEDVIDCQRCEGRRRAVVNLPKPTIVDNRPIESIHGSFTGRDMF